MDKVRHFREKIEAMKEFDVAIRCQDGVWASDCPTHRGQAEWLEAITADGRTARQVIQDFQKSGKINEIELREFFGEGKKKISRVRKVAMAGIIVVAGVLFYKGGKLILRLITRK